MLMTVQGTYENGKVMLLDEPPTKDRVKVLVTFLTDENAGEPMDKTAGQMTLNNAMKSFSFSEDLDLLAAESNKKNLLRNHITFGSLKGQLSLPADFDEPLEDLKEYM